MKESITKLCPCNNCLVYIMCKNRIKIYLNLSDTEIVILAFFNILSPTCKPITTYVDKEIDSYKRAYDKNKVKFYMGPPKTYAAKLIRAIFK